MISQFVGSDDEVKLFCLIYDTDRIFSVNIAKSKIMGDLKDKIWDKKQKTFHNVTADDLMLWKVCHPEDSVNVLSNTGLEAQ
jgi:hypothetical protein